MSLLLIPDTNQWHVGDMPAIRRMNGGAAILRAMAGEFTDPAFAHQRATAGDFPFLGIYQYVEAAETIADQTAALRRRVGTLAGHEVLFADIEEGAGSQLGRADEWIGRVTDWTGRRPGLYSDEAFAVEHGLAPLFNGSAVHSWVAAFGDHEPALGHTLWQSTNGAIGSHITDWPGAGRCDTSVYHGTLGDLAAAFTPNRPAPGGQVRKHTTAGQQSLAGLCAQQHPPTNPATVLRLTAEHSHLAVFPENVAAYVNKIFRGELDAHADMPAGLTLWLPDGDAPNRKADTDE